ncbi:MAG: bifunctional DNA-binding transcriptional regulator/O6-methylguanine-DNA methyltransferase Ada [Chloroflexota bacterium]|nr:bifunctional DNA-binding transcriptional regulator/O6-methylguanine-DNA methyltransferase Ada [Chloroflexota bacterium]
MTSIEAPQILVDQTCWQSVLERDRQSDGRFVYAVRSTGIYCRPSCPSRKPRREQVSFFPNADAAQEQGYRPCKRCRPEETSGEDTDTRLVRLAHAYLASGHPEPVGLEQVSAQAGVTPARLRKAFKNVTGLSFSQFADARRLDQLKTWLQKGRDVTSALCDSGYSSTSRLYEKAPAQLGMTPNTYRKGGQNVEITYAVIDWSLGQILVAATDKGVCAVRLGDDAATLESDLKKQYPNASLERDNGQLHDWVGLMLATLEGHPATHSLPLDVQATAFQRRVWQHLMTIPRDETRTYRQVAEALGEPRSTRAVANACAANPVASVVPCHRVIRQDGGLGGYR